MASMDPQSDSDAFFMHEALREARRAAAMGEVPIGAVVVCGGEIIGRGHNLRETDRDPTAHAEMVAMRRAAHHKGAWRLTGTTVYATIEPCPMCAGALVMARVARLVYGAPDPKAGAVHSLYRITEDPRLNHRVEVRAGVLAEACAQEMRDFFQRLRS